MGFGDELSLKFIYAVALTFKINALGHKETKVGLFVTKSFLKTYNTSLAFQVIECFCIETGSQQCPYNGRTA